MAWLHEHLIIFYGIGIGLLILVGAVLVSDKFATSPTPTARQTWDAFGGATRVASGDPYADSLLNVVPLENTFTIADLYRNLESNPDRFYASFNPENTGPDAYISGTTTENGSFAFSSTSIDALLAALKPSSSLSLPTGSDEDLKNVYSYIPSSIVGTPPSPDKEMSKEQRALYEYGNEAGGSIETYNSLWGDSQAQIFKGFIEDMRNHEKADQALQVAEGLTEVGDSLGRMEVLPPAVAAAHKKLVASYKTLGKNLTVVTKAYNDETLLSSIGTYNASAEQFARDYLAIVTILSVNNITFGADEPGRVFVFTPIVAQ